MGILEERRNEEGISMEPGFTYNFIFPSRDEELGRLVKDEFLDCIFQVARVCHCAKGRAFNYGLLMP